MGEPGRFTINVVPRIPETLRLKGGELRLFSAFRAHHFGKAVEHPAADRPRGFWSDIPGGNSRASGRDHQPRLLRLLAERIFNRMLLIRHEDMADDGEAVLLEKLDNGGTGDIGALASKPRIANGNDSGTKHKKDCKGARNLEPSGGLVFMA